MSTDPRFEKDPTLPPEPPVPAAPAAPPTPAGSSAPNAEPYQRPAPVGGTQAPAQPEPERTSPPDQHQAPEREPERGRRGGAAGGQRGGDDNPLRGSKASALWAFVFLLIVVLVLLVIFIAQNTQRVQVRFLGWEGTAPLVVALLVATAAGLVIAGTAGAVRILQLRRRVKRVAKQL